MVQVALGALNGQLVEIVPLKRQFAPRETFYGTI